MENFRIKEKDFNRLIGDIEKLTLRQPDSKTQALLWFERLKDCDLRDFEKAVRDADMLFAVRRFGLEYTVLKTYIAKHRRVRKDAEDYGRQKKEMSAPKEKRSIAGLPTKVQELIRKIHE